MRCSLARTAPIAACLAVFVGCGAENRLGRLPVSGQVTLDGAPLDFGSITFVPQGGGTISSGATIVDGKYSMPEAKGLPPGDYVVRINASKSSDNSDRAMDAAGPGPLSIERIAPAFNTRSKLTVRVIADQVAQFDFNTTSIQP